MGAGASDAERPAGADPPDSCSGGRPSVGFSSSGGGWVTASSWDGRADVMSADPLTAVRGEGMPRSPRIEDATWRVPGTDNAMPTDVPVVVGPGNGAHRHQGEAWRRPPDASAQGRLDQPPANGGSTSSCGAGMQRGIEVVHGDLVEQVAATLQDGGELRPEAVCARLQHIADGGRRGHVEALLLDARGGCGGGEVADGQRQGVGRVRVVIVVSRRSPTSAGPAAGTTGR